MDPGIKAQRRIFLFKNYCSTFDLVNLKTPRTCIQGKSHFLLIEILEPSKDGRWKSEKGFCPESMWCVFSNGPNQTKVSHTYSNIDILKHQLHHHLHDHHLLEHLVRTLFTQLNKLPQEWGEALKQRLVHKTASRKWACCEKDGLGVILLQNGFLNKDQCIKLPTENW